MDLVLTIRDLIVALRARDFTAAKTPLAVLLRFIADQLARPVIGATAEAEDAVAELAGEVATLTGEPVAIEAGGVLLKKLAVLLLKLLPLLIL
jgi:hypothetical protein